MHIMFRTEMIDDGSQTVVAVPFEARHRGRVRDMTPFMLRIAGVDHIGLRTLFQGLFDWPGKALELDWSDFSGVWNGYRIGDAMHQVGLQRPWDQDIEYDSNTALIMAGTENRRDENDGNTVQNCVRDICDLQKALEATGVSL